jgi:hypothetical protein
MGLVKLPVHRLGTVKADRMNSRIAFARMAEGLGVPSQPWMLAKGENSLLQRQKAPKLQRWQLLCA